MRIKDDPKYHERLRRCKEMRELGYSVKKMAAILGLLEKTLSGWLSVHKDEYLKQPPTNNIKVVRLE